RSAQQLGHFLSWGEPCERLAWAAVELGGDRVQIGLAVGGQIGAFGQVLAQQPVGVFVRPALPRRVWITEEDLYCGVLAEPAMGREFLSLVPGQRAQEMRRQAGDARLERVDDVLG